MKKKPMTIHIEEKLTGGNRGLCHAEMQWNDRFTKTNMTTKMSLATCPKCIEIRKARVAQAVETRRVNKKLVEMGYRKA